MGGQAIPVRGLGASLKRVEDGVVGNGFGDRPDQRITGLRDLERPAARFNAIWTGICAATIATSAVVPQFSRPCRFMGLPVSGIPGYSSSIVPGGFDVMS
jgi:hypothetical protein